MHIKVKKGLDIPIVGQPTGPIKPILPGGQASAMAYVPQIALTFSAEEELQPRLLVKAGDIVKIGQPLVEDKKTPGRMFAAPAAGVIKEVVRGAKRVLKAIVIDVSREESYQDFPIADIKIATREQLVQRLMESGCFTHIRSRPFNLLADPHKVPKAIFVKALESAPFVPPAEYQVEGHEAEFQAGLNALQKLTEGPVHLVYRLGTTCKAFTEAAGVQRHTAEGPHPVSNASVHIERLAPIRSVNDLVWTLNAWDVVAIGYLLTRGRTFVERVISIAGPGIIEGRTGYFKARTGFPISALAADRLKNEEVRLISGDPLMGEKVDMQDCMGSAHFAFSAIPENVERDFLHFMGLGVNRYTFSRAYLSGHLDNAKREYEFTTSLHGEHRAFIDSTLYDQVMPLNVPTMLLVKAVMAEDFEFAETLGLLEVDSEDFALPTFVCPSKMEMVEIMKAGIKRYAKEE